VRVAPPPERAALLLVGEPAGVLELSDRRGHPERDAEVTSAPGDGISEFHGPANDPSGRRSPERLIEAVWASTDSDSSKQSLIEAVITVSSRMLRTGPVKQLPSAGVIGLSSHYCSQRRRARWTVMSAAISTVSGRACMIWL